MFILYFNNVHFCYVTVFSTHMIVPCWCLLHIIEWIFMSGPWMRYLWNNIYFWIVIHHLIVHTISFSLYFLSLVRCLWQISLDQSWRLSIQIQPTQVSCLHMTMKLPCPSEITNMIISCQRMRLEQEDQTKKRWILAWESFEMASRLFASINSSSLESLFSYAIWFNFL